MAADFSAYLSAKHEVVVFTPKYRCAQTRQAPRLGRGDFRIKTDYKVFRLLPGLKYGNGAWLPQLVWRLTNFDAVQLHYPFFGGAEMVWLAKILFRRKFKLFIHYHMEAGGLPFWVKILSLPSCLIRNSLFKMADKVTVASLDYVENSNISGIYNKYKDKFYELPFTVDTKIFCPKKNKRSKESIELLFVGGLDKAHYFKGLDIFFKALNGLNPDKWRLNIVGSGSRRKYYENLAKKFKINEKIKFKGELSQNNLVKEYQNADLFILPSINSNEAFGLVLIEAMACGAPVIATDLPGVRKVFSNKEGLLARPGDSNDLRNKIQGLLEDSGWLNDMGKAGRELVLKKYSKDKIRDKYENLFDK